MYDSRTKELTCLLGASRRPRFSRKTVRPVPRSLDRLAAKGREGRSAFPKVKKNRLCHVNELIVMPAKCIRTHASNRYARSLTKTVGRSLGTVRAWQRRRMSTRFSREDRSSLAVSTDGEQN
jgi:hypothetical protein